MGQAGGTPRALRDSKQGSKGWDIGSRPPLQRQQRQRRRRQPTPARSADSHATPAHPVVEWGAAALQVLSQPEGFFANEDAEQPGGLSDRQQLSHIKARQQVADQLIGQHGQGAKPALSRVGASLRLLSIHRTCGW